MRLALVVCCCPVMCSCSWFGCKEQHEKGAAWWPKDRNVGVKNFSKHALNQYMCNSHEKDLHLHWTRMFMETSVCYAHMLACLQIMILAAVPRNMTFRRTKPPSIQRRPFPSLAPPSRRRLRKMARQQAPRMPAVRQLQMASGGPRGRSGPGVNIEGPGGAKVVVASAMPIETVRQQQRISADADEYGDSGEPPPPPLLAHPLPKMR